MLPAADSAWSFDLYILGVFYQACPLVYTVVSNILGCSQVSAHVRVPDTASVRLSSGKRGAFASQACAVQSIVQMFPACVDEPYGTRILLSDLQQETLEYLLAN